MALKPWERDWSALEVSAPSKTKMKPWERDWTAPQADTVQKAAIAPQKPWERDLPGTGAPAIPEPPKPQASLGGVLKDVGRAIYDIPVQTKGAIGAALEGKDPYSEQTWSDTAISEAKRRTQERRAIPGGEEEIGFGITRQDVRDLPQNLGFSLTSAGAGLGAGLPTAAIATPAAGWAAGGAASGVAAYNMAANQFVRDVIDSAEQEQGRPLSQQEKLDLQNKFSDAASEYGLWEAIPEAVGNVAGLKIIASPLKGALGKAFGKNLGTRILGKMSALYGTELGTETVTQMGQHNVEVDTGQTQGERRSFTSPGDYYESLKEVAPQVFLLTTVMGGVGGAGVKVYEKTVTEPQQSLALQRAAASGQFRHLSDEDLDSFIVNSEKLAAKRKNDKGLQSAVDALKKEKQYRDTGGQQYEAPVGPYDAQDIESRPSPPQALPAPDRTLYTSKAGQTFNRDQLRERGFIGQTPSGERFDILKGDQSERTIPAQPSPMVSMAQALAPKTQAMTDELTARRERDRAFNAMEAEQEASRREAMDSAFGQAEDEAAARRADDERAAIFDAAMQTKNPIAYLRGRVKGKAGELRAEIERRQQARTERAIMDEKPPANPAMLEAFKKAHGDLDAAANEAATSPANATPEPTEAQQKAGNYKKGHVAIQGLDISIENPKGSVRRGTDEDGRAWETQMQSHYGYIKGTVGKDKDHLDVFLSDNAKQADSAWIIDQVDPKTGKFDEHKIVIGPQTEADALAAYQANYEPGWQGAGAITQMPIDEFKAWLKSGKTKVPLALNKEETTNAKQEQVAGATDAGVRTQVGPEVGQAEGRGVPAAEGSEGVQPGGQEEALIQAARTQPTFDKFSSYARGRFGREQHRQMADSGELEQAWNQAHGENVSRETIPPDLIYRKTDGKPFPSEKAAKMAARARKINAEPVAVDGGFALRERVENQPDNRQEYTGPERRKDTNTRRRVDQMTPEEMRAELLVDPMTGLGNRRAYEEADRLPVQASVDVDALKWINDNMGHESGDHLIRLMGEALAKHADRAYHISGDEFVVETQTQEEADAILAAVADELRTAIITAEHDGKVTTKTGVEFSYGTGETLKAADAALRKSKSEREAAGLRPARGEKPAGVAERSTEGREDNRGKAEEVDPEKKARELGRENPEGSVTELRFKALKGVENVDGHTIDRVTQAVHDGQYEGILEIAASLPVPVHETDISRSLADRAFMGTSHTPEKRGESFIRSYVRGMVDAWRDAEQRITDDASRERVIDEFEKFKQGYVRRLNAYLNSHSQVMSSFIVGPAKFPTERNRKRSDSADKRIGEATEWYEKGMKRLRRAAKGPLDRSPQSELEMVRNNLREREKSQEMMKAGNVIIRKKGLSEEQKLTQLVEMGFTEKQASEAMKPDFMNRTGFPPYLLQNNNAEIRRLKQREQSLTERSAAAETVGASEHPFDGGVVELDYQNNYLRIRHNEKPSAEVRAELKSNGFRWSPKNTAWQRKLTDNAVAVARRITGAEIAPKVDEEAESKYHLDTALAKVEGLRSNQIRMSVNRLTKAWSDVVKIEVVQRQGDLPKSVTKRYEALAERGKKAIVRGIFMPTENKVYLVADNIADIKQAHKTLFHEVLGHYGLRVAFGGKLNNLLDQVAESHPDRIAEIARTYGYDLTNPKHRLNAAEEVLARMAEKNENPGLLVRVYAAIRRWARNLGVNLKLSNSELRAIVATARRAVIEGMDARAKVSARRSMAGAEPAFDIADEAGANSDEVEEARKEWEEKGTDSKYFKRWFGDSKVVDEDGNPLVVYHGSPSTFSIFRVTDDIGFHFGTHEAAENALQMFDRIGDVRAFYLNIKNPIRAKHDPGTWDITNDAVRALPLTLDQRSRLEDAFEINDEDNETLKKFLQGEGFDGISYPNAFEGGDSWIAFDSEQIKSATDNRGTFSPDDTNILFDMAEEEAGKAAKANPSPVARVKHIVDSIRDAVDRATPLGTLPDKDLYLKDRYLTLGKIAEVDEAARKIYNAFRDAGEHAESVYKYLTSAEAKPSMIKDEKLRAEAVKVKQQIIDVGQKLVDRGLLDKDTYEANKGSYLPRIYLKHLLKEEDFVALGTGKKPSDLGYLKKRKDIPENVRRLILGEITDPGYLASKGFGQQMRDVAILDWIQQIAGNNKWILPNSLVKWEGRSVTPYWLKSESNRIRIQSRYYTEENRKQALEIAQKMEDAANDHIAEYGDAVPDGFKMMPNTPRYGALRGLIVRREIYNDIVGSTNIISGDESVAEAILGNGGVATKFTQLWKWSKVAANPPAQVRNFLSNGILLHLSGVPFHMVPARVIQAIREIRTNGKHWQVAKKYGVTESTFSAQELHRIERELLDLEARHAGKWSLSSLKNFAGKVMDITGDVYQFSEAIFKTAKIIDEMKAGKTESDAAIEAQKWLFDYSLVSPTMRYLRNAPVGVPFVTFYMKALPRLLEIAVHHPLRFAPYVAIPYIMTAMVAGMADVEPEDVDNLKKALPQWLQQRGHAYFIPAKDEQGRWQAVDFGYFLPWTMWTELLSSTAKGELGEAMMTSGLFGGPLPDMIAAIKTNTDPFTKKQIVNEFDPPAKQVASIMSYLTRLSAPTWLTDYGFAGHMYRAVSGTVDKYGEPKTNEVQAALRLVGVNVYPISPERTRAENIRRMRYEISRIKARRTMMLRDRNLDPEERKKIAETYSEMMKQRADELREYVKESRVHPNLR